MSKSAARGTEHPEQHLEQLRLEHQQLEQRLKLLRRPRSVSPQEQAEIQGIKKRKLAIKDQLMTFESL